MKYFLILFVVFFFIFPILAFHVEELSFVFNRSKSMRGYVFLKEAIKRDMISHLKVGDIVVIEHDLYPHQILLKKVSHLSQESFDHKNAIMGRKRLNESTKVPFQHIAVIGDHPESFDSRYEDFGFVHFSKIKGIAWQIF